MADANVRVGILMGSDSDWETVREAAAALSELQIPYEVHVASAHRSPELVREYVRSAPDKGIGVLIAAAGGAAHLAGVVAAQTTLPVIGIPIATPALGGLDSLLSTVQMPAGVPVATVAIGPAGARNAGILAAQILALADPALRKRIEELKRGLAQNVQEKDKALQQRLLKPS